MLRLRLLPAAPGQHPPARAAAECPAASRRRPAPPQAARLQPYDAFRVGPFCGLTVCFSGLSASRKVALAELVARGGGQHSPALDKKCTHLVTNSAASEKYR